MAKIDPYFQSNYFFCPRCGAKFTSWEEPLHCNQCGFEIYGNPKPATAIFVIKNGKILLTKRGNKPQKNAWDTPGGFIETDESIEASAQREMKEETGLKIKIVDFLGSVPDLYDDIPILTIGLKAQIISGTLCPNDDVASLHWVELDHLPKKFGFKSIEILINQLVKQEHAKH